MVSKIEGLLFDLGGVVINIDFDKAFQIWQKHSPLDIEQIRNLYSMDDHYERHERGEIDGSQYFAHLRQVLQLNGSDADIAIGWNAIFDGEIEPTINTLLAVRKTLPTFAFTNSNATHQVEWMGRYPKVFEAFQHVFVSSELGLRKPEHAAFDAIAKATGIRPSATLFFDDTLENVEGARAAGLQAVHVRSPDDVKRALVDIGALQPD